RQELMRRPLTRTVQAPHWPWSQPFFEPVRPRWLRSASRSVVRGSSWTAKSLALIRSDIGIVGTGVAEAATMTASFACRALAGNPAERSKAAAALPSSTVRRVGPFLLLASDIDDLPLAMSGAHAGRCGHRTPRLLDAGGGDARAGVLSGKRRHCQDSGE